MLWKWFFFFFFLLVVSLPLFSLPVYHPSPCVLLDATLNEINEFHIVMLVLNCVCIVWYLDKTLLLKWSVTYWCFEIIAKDTMSATCWCFEIIAKDTITHTYHWQSLAIHSMCSHFIVPYIHQGKKSWCCVHWIYSVTNQMLASRQQVSMQNKPKSFRTTLLSMHNQFAWYNGTGQLSPGRDIN